MTRIVGFLGVLTENLLEYDDFLRAYRRQRVEGNTMDRETSIVPCKEGQRYYDRQLLSYRSSSARNTRRTTESGKGKKQVEKQDDGTIEDLVNVRIR